MLLHDSPVPPSPSVFSSWPSFPQLSSDMLTGEKVILRSVTRNDLSRALGFWNDVEVKLLSGGDPPKPHTMEEMEVWYDGLQKGLADFAIEVDGVYIGSCGLFSLDAEARVCYLGITIGDRAYWGKGYGRDAVNLLLEYAFRLRNIHKVWLTVNGSNERAIRSYRSCGFVEEGRQRAQVWRNGVYDEKVYMGLLREEWPDPHRSGVAAD